MRCPNCGAEIGTSNTCEYCGSTITSEMKKEQEILNKRGCPKNTQQERLPQMRKYKHKFHS